MLKQLTGLCASLYGIAQAPSQQTCNSTVHTVFPCDVIVHIVHTPTQQVGWFHHS